MAQTADSGASFHALPIELIIRILDHVVPDGLQPAAQVEKQMFAGPSARHALELPPFGLASVCKDWRKRILSIAAVWRRVYLSFAPASQAFQSQLQYLVLVLRRSAGAPLHIYVDQAPGTVTDQQQTLLRVLQVILPRAQRLAIRTDKTLLVSRSCLFAHLKQDVPLLQYLSVHDCLKNLDNRIRTLPRTLFTGAPQLVEVTLVDVPLTWFDCSLWDKLESVTLVRCIFSHEDLVAFGTWWPNLQRLVIEQAERNDCYFVLNDEDGAFDGRNMPTLPHLHTLALRTPFWSPQTIFYRAHLQLGSLRTLVMRYDGLALWGEYPFHRLRQDMRIFFQHAAPALEHITVQRSWVSDEFVTDVIGAAPSLRRLHFEATTMKQGFFKTWGDRDGRLSIEDLAFNMCSFHGDAAETFARFIENACLPLKGASSSTTTQSIALKRLHISQVQQAAKAPLLQPILDRIRAAVHFADIEEITDFNVESVPFFVGQHTASRRGRGTVHLTSVVHRLGHG